MSARHAPERVLVLGCGSVAQCLLPMLIDHFGLEPSRVRVLESRDNVERIAGPISRGVIHERGEVTEANLDEVLGERVGVGDLLIDLAWNIGHLDIVDWCRRHQVHYLNTSLELWDPYSDQSLQPPTERTLYVRHLALRELVRSWGDNAGPSGVVEHGANPGLVSHFVKQGLEEIAAAVLAGPPGPEDADEVERALRAGEHAALARALGVKTIHIAERDTQVTREPRRPGEFVNTWSVDGFYEEGVAPAEMGWGTHERTLPPRAVLHDHGPGNQICLAQMAHKTLVRSAVPDARIVGMVIRHGEAFTISDHLTVRDGDRVIYRPTVHYAYCCSDAAWASFVELEGAGYPYPEVQRIMGDDIVEGRDELGVLLLGHRFNGWWTGMLTSIEEARAVAPHQNATTVQVAAAIIGAIDWMLRNPTGGLRVPDELPWREVLEVARPYLGTLYSGPLDFDPVRDRADWFERFSGRTYDEDDHFQFVNFLLS